MKKLIVVLMLAFASTAQAQWWADSTAHPENYQLMAPIDGVDSFWAYDQPQIYETWWKQIADCEHIRLPSGYQSVRFFQVNGHAFMPAEFPYWLDGLTYPVASEIYVASRFVLSEELIKHEMLHWIIWSDGYRLYDQHPREMFETCGIHTVGP